MNLGSDLLDTILVLAGVVLVVTGLVMFIRSKTSSSASSVEAFGIKLNVTHPSLILVLAGVGLMVAPRLFPDPNGTAPAANTPAAAGAPAAPAAVSESEALLPETPPAMPSAPSAAPPSLPAVAPSPTPAPVARVTQSAPPARSEPTASVAQKPAAAPARPVAAPTPVAKPAPAPAAQPAAPAVAKPAATPPEKLAAIPPPTPAAAPRPARPTLAYAALGLPISRDFWSGETQSSYTRRMQNVLEQAGRDVLRADPRSLGLGRAAFDAWWNESSAHPRSRALCSAAPAPRALLAARVETPPSLSYNESAYWPELRLKLYLCESNRVYRHKQTMSPNNNDAWPFSVELNGQIERFMRNYRADLSE